MRQWGRRINADAVTQRSQFKSVVFEKKHAMHYFVTKIALLSREQDVRKRLVCDLPVSRVLSVS